MLYLGASRVAARVRSHDYEVCTHCGYLLYDLGDTGVCPECSRDYDIPWARLHWEETRKQPLLCRIQPTFAALLRYLSPGKLKGE